jgi:hypothetical protein
VPPGETRLVIASAAKQSSLMRVNSGLLRRLAPRNDGAARRIEPRKISNLESGIKLDSNLQNWQGEFARGGRGASSMPVILSDLLLFGCTAAFVTWLVIQVSMLY